ncbi:MAG: arylformamidase [Flavobacteriales bacterium]|jgi:arylformamidase
MIARIEHLGKNYKIDLSQALDISMRLSEDPSNSSAWYVNPVSIEPVRIGDWIGDVKQGGSVNFRDIAFNPHGNGTHTECVGHISKEDYSINQCLKEFFFLSKLVTISPEKLANGDQVIGKKQIEDAFGDSSAKAIVIRTSPNESDKLQRQYSNSNPPYISEEAALFIREKGIEHLLIDLPSVDKEQDEGKLLAHHAFWNYPNSTRVNATITELIYVPNTIVDGPYFLSLTFASFENDASPSKPLLFKLM